MTGKGQGGKEVKKWRIEGREWMAGKMEIGQRERGLADGLGPHISRDSNSDVKRGHML